MIWCVSNCVHAVPSFQVVSLFRSSSHVWWEATPSEPPCGQQYWLCASFSEETLSQLALWKPLQRSAHHPAQWWLLPVGWYLYIFGRSPYADINKYFPLISTPILSLSWNIYGRRLPFRPVRRQTLLGGPWRLCFRLHQLILLAKVLLRVSLITAVLQRLGLHEHVQAVVNQPKHVPGEQQDRREVTEKHQTKDCVHVLFPWGANVKLLSLLCSYRRL